MQSVVRREYWTYSQGPQRGSGAHGVLPKGAPHGTRGRVAPLGNGTDHCLRGRALPQAPWDALMRQNTRDTTLVGRVDLRQVFPEVRVGLRHAAGIEYGAAPDLAGEDGE